MSAPVEPIFARTITLDATAGDAVQGWVEDNFHHFGVRLTHDGVRVLRAEAEARRYPWSTCAAAGTVLRELAGQPLENAGNGLSAHVEMSRHCTHMFELAALTMAQARRGGSRRYDIRVSDVTPSEKPDPLALDARLRQDDEVVLSWSVRDETIVGPSFWAGQPIIAGFRQRLTTLAPEDAERAWVLRRGVWLARGDRAFQEVPVASQTGLGPVCYTYQPERAATALAMPGSRRRAGATV